MLWVENGNVLSEGTQHILNRHVRCTKKIRGETHCRYVTLWAILFS